MSQIPREQLSYHRVIAEYFHALRGSGLMLSPLDSEQVAEWERRGLPVAVVCRGLRRGFEEHVANRPAGSPPPRSLRALRGSVEAEWRGYRSGRVGEAPAPPPERSAAEARIAAARAFVDTGARSTSPRLAAAYRASAAALEESLGRVPSPTLDDVEDALARADAALITAWLGDLPRSERAALGRRITLRAGARGRIRRATHRETLRAHLLDAARDAGLLCLRGTV